jgi:hypothetical protein
MAPTPDALLFITTGCPHCPGVLAGLAELVKGGAIGRLEVVNVAAHPERAAALGVRAAPWTRIGPFVLEGAQTPAALKAWAVRAAAGEGGTEYLRGRLAQGGLAEAERYVGEEPARLRELLPLVADPEAPMAARVGAGALIEGHAGGPTLAALVPELVGLSSHRDYRVRADACHYLGLSGTPEALAALRERLADENPEVREIAAEGLAAAGA